MGITSQPEVVRLLDSRRSPNVRLIRSPGQAKENAIKPLAIQLARARLLSRKPPKHMLSKAHEWYFHLMSGDEFICGSTIRSHHKSIQNRGSPPNAPLPQRMSCVDLSLVDPANLTLDMVAHCAKLTLPGPRRSSWIISLGRRSVWLG